MGGGGPGAQGPPAQRHPGERRGRAGNRPPYPSQSIAAPIAASPRAAASGSSTRASPPRTLIAQRRATSGSAPRRGAPVRRAAARCAPRGRSAGRTGTTAPRLSRAPVHAQRAYAEHMMQPPPASPDRASPCSNAVQSIGPSRIVRAKIVCSAQRAKHLAGHVRAIADDAAVRRRAHLLCVPGRQTRPPCAQFAANAGDLRLLAAHRVGHALGIDEADAGHQAHPRAGERHRDGASGQVGDADRAGEIGHLPPALLLPIAPHASTRSSPRSSQSPTSARSVSAKRPSGTCSTPQWGLAPVADVAAGIQQERPEIAGAPVDADHGARPFRLSMRAMAERAVRALIQVERC